MVVREYVQNGTCVLRFAGIYDHGMLLGHENGAVRRPQFGKNNSQTVGFFPAAAQQQDKQQPQNGQKTLTECGHGY